MAAGVLHFLRSLWPFLDDDLQASDRLVRKLEIPDDTKRFVFAIREPESQAVIYILCVQNLSERSASDAENLIRCVRPGAVVAQVNEIESEDGKLLGDSDGNSDHSVPTSSFQVIRRCFLHKISKEKYESVAGSLVLKEIFGVGFNGHFSAAKRVAEEVSSSFLLLESPFVKVEKENDCSSEVHSGSSFQALGLQPGNLVPRKLDSVVPLGARRYVFSEDYVRSQMLKPLRSHLVQFSSNPVNIRPINDYKAPSYARSVYPLLVDLHDMFLDIPLMGRALALAQTLLYNVSEGETVDSRLLSEVYAFRIAAEGLRIALNNAGRAPIGKMQNHQSARNGFSALSDEEKSHALLAEALRSHAKTFKSLVAVVDATVLAGLRKHWNTAVPPQVKDLVEELVAGSTEDVETTNHRRLTDKPVVTVGAGATAVLGASSLSKVVPASTFMKAVTFKVPASFKLLISQTQKLVLASMKFFTPAKAAAPTSAAKAAASAERIRTVVHSVIVSAEKTSLSAMRAAFYEIMRKRRIRPVGVLPWATFGCSVATCSTLPVYGDGIECAVESVPAAPSIASLGRGIRSLHRASEGAGQTDGSRVQKSIETLVNRFKKW